MSPTPADLDLLSSWSFDLLEPLLVPFNSTMRIARGHVRMVEQGFCRPDPPGGAMAVPKRQ